MLYLANASSAAIRQAMRAGLIGQMCTPAEGRPPLPAVTWSADNSCYGHGWPGEHRWLDWLERHIDAAPRCLFAAAPDIPGDARATLDRSWRWLPVIRRLGYPAALVAQDGLEHLAVPWDAFDVLFIGGTTTWKLGPHAAALTAQAHHRGIRTQLGRVNTRTRLRHALTQGHHSVDGTCLTYAPDHNLTRLLRWLREPPDPQPTTGSQHTAHEPARRRQPERRTP